LCVHKDEIDGRFGEPLAWLRQENLKSSPICYEILDIGLRDRGGVAKVQKRMIDAMVRLEKSLRPHINQVGWEMELKWT
jgi:hypothetical protein